ncbi:MAG: NAD(+) kinase [Firmicutes bacterium]|jgi:NAD+ kinase|nr:NAD(+) kinase [Bacillota bacterium]
MMRFGLIVHLGKDIAISTANDLAKTLPGRGVQVFLDPETADYLDLPEASFGDQDLAGKLDVVVVLGGDGALLNAARRLAGTSLPILGVNVGHLGFLTEVELKGMGNALDRILSGRYEVEERMMVHAEVRRGGKGVVGEFIGLNDVVVTKGAFARMIRLDTYVGSSLIGTYPADGAIVASPTGSTGYSLSAGGPIVNPVMNMLILTFICPHTLGARSFVVSPEDDVRIVLEAQNEDVMLTIDGQVGFALEHRDEVVVKPAVPKTYLIKLGNRDFYEVLKTRLAEGKV